MSSSISIPCHGGPLDGSRLRVPYPPPPVWTIAHYPEVQISDTMLPLDLTVSPRSFYELEIRREDLGLPGSRTPSRIYRRDRYVWKGDQSD